MTLHLVEVHRTGHVYNEGVVIALTASACRALEKDNIKYHIPEEFYDWVELWKHDMPLYKKELLWMKELDDVLKQMHADVRRLDIPLANLYKYYLKHSIDPFILNARIASAVIDQIKPERIIFYDKKREGRQLTWQLGYAIDNQISQVLPVITKARNIDYELVEINADSKDGTVKKIGSFRLNPAWLDRLQRYISDIAECVFCLPERWRNRRSLKKQKNILLLYLVWGLKEFAIDAYKKGHNVYCMELLGDGRFEIVKYNPLTRLTKIIKMLSCKIRGNKRNRVAGGDPVWERVFAKIDKKEETWKLLLEECQIDCKELLRPILRHFIVELCPAMLKYAEYFSGYYKSNNIEYVITPMRWQLWDFPGFWAARAMNNVKAIFTTHGYSIFNSSLLLLTEVGADPDVYIAVDDELKTHLERLFQEKISANTKVLAGNLWQLSRSKLSKKKRNGVKNAQSRKRIKILYVPIPFDNGSRRRLDACRYPDCWLYGLRKKTIELFAKHKDVDFVYKGMKGWEDPIKDVIEENRYKNIAFSTQNLLRELLSVDAAIIDFPSTPMYESMLVEIPTIAFTHKGFPVRSAARDKYGDNLKEFGSCDEYLDVLDEYLHNADDRHVLKVYDPGMPDLIQIVYQGGVV